jgi:ABC-2 type transport system ATP-binding protein
VLAEYNKETGATILISSHNLNHTTDVCPRIVLLENGIIIRDIDNRDRQAETELESYFNVSFAEEQAPEAEDETTKEVTS